MGRNIDLKQKEMTTETIVPFENESFFNNINNITVDMTVVIGDTSMAIKDIQKLGAGSVIEFNHNFKKPVNIYANGLLVGHGTLIMQNNNLAILVTDVTNNEKNS